MQKDDCATGKPSLSHIGFAVKDVDSSVKFLTSNFALGPWQVFEYETQKEDMIAGEAFKIKIGLGKLGSTITELIQPLAGKSIWSDFIETKGEGIHHMAFTVLNWDEMVSKLEGEGAKILVCALSPEGKKWGYFKTKSGGIIELMDNIKLSI